MAKRITTPIARFFASLESLDRFILSLRQNQMAVVTGNQQMFVVMLPKMVVLKRFVKSFPPKSSTDEEFHNGLDEAECAEYFGED